MFSRQPLMRLVPNVDAETENRRRGFWLRMSRERANLTQPAAAEWLGLSNQSKATISAWEAGTREPKMSMLRRLAALYGVPLALFLDPPMTAFEAIDGLALAARAGADPLEVFREFVDVEMAEQSSPGELTSLLADLEQARQSGGEEGVRRAMQRLTAPDRSPPVPSRQPRLRDTGVRRG